MNKLEKFKDKADKLLDKLEQHINKMPLKGNSSINCQRTFLQQNLNEVSYAINGITKEHLKPEEDEVQ